jgi:hypothetical protein
MRATGVLNIPAREVEGQGHVNEPAKRRGYAMAKAVINEFLRFTKILSASAFQWPSWRAKLNDATYSVWMKIYLPVIFHHE